MRFMQPSMIVYPIEISHMKIFFLPQRRVKHHFCNKQQRNFMHVFICIVCLDGREGGCVCECVPEGLAGG